MAAHYPPVAFHFKVEVNDLPGNADDVRFTEVSGLAVELSSEEVPEGGENRFVQAYPLRAKYTPLILKRGLLPRSEILGWILECVTNTTVKPKNIDVTLLNEEGQPLFTWHVVKAWPTKWSVADLNASSNAVLVESLQFSYQHFTLDRS